jgi:anti-sigma B factor antagonist
MSPLARVSDERAGDIGIIVVDGEVDASNAADVGDRVRASVTNRSRALVVDLSGMRYIDSAGIDVLFELDRELRQRRQALHLVVPPESPITRTLAIAGLAATIPTHGTREAALAGAAGS